MSRSGSALNLALRSGRRTVLNALTLATLVALGSTSASAQTTTCRKEPCPRQEVNSRAATFGTIQVGPQGRGLPVRVTGESGGPADAPEVPLSHGGPCQGFTGVRPDHVLVLTSDMPNLRLSVHSTEVASLIVHGPDGWSCDAASDPALEGRFRAGTWRIWVGNRLPATYTPYSLDVSVANASTPPLPAPTRPPPIEPEPLPPAPHYSLSGRFEDLDVRFEGGSIDELHRSCMAFASSARNLSWVDDIVFHGQSYRNSSAYWSPEALCALVALNARPTGASAADARAQGLLEGAPFEVHGTPDEVRAVLSRHLATAVDMTWADDLVVNGQTRRNRSGYWSLDEVVMLIMALSSPDL